MDDDVSPRVLRFHQKQGHTFDMYIADDEAETPGAFVGTLQLTIRSNGSFYEVTRDGVVVKHGEIDFSYWDANAIRPTLEQIGAAYYPDAVVEVLRPR